MTDTRPSAQLDAKGLACPLPIIKARQAIEPLATDEVLEVLATDPGSVPDFQNWTRMTGHELLESSEADGVFRYLIRKKA